MTSQNLSLSGNTMGVTSGARSANPSGAPEFIPSFSVVPVARSLMFGAVFCRSLFVLVPLAIVLSFLLGTTLDYPIVLVCPSVYGFCPLWYPQTFLKTNNNGGRECTFVFFSFQYQSLFL